jgi:multisubunit Na+/H+ antiporter MnhF subunit
MNQWAIAAIVLFGVLLVCLALPSFRDPADGLMALAVAGTTATTILLLLAEAFHRQPFADLAIASALMSFVGSLAFARLLERKL